MERKRLLGDVPLGDTLRCRSEKGRICFGTVSKPSVSLTLAGGFYL